MYQSIKTRYHGPNQVTGARISASCPAGRLYRSYDHSLSSGENHTSAARDLAKQVNWTGSWYGGALWNERNEQDDHVFIVADEPCFVVGESNDKA